MTSLSEHTRSSSPLVLLPPAWPDLKSLAQCLLNCPLLCRTLIDSFIAARRVLFTPVWSHLPFVENPPGALPSLRFNRDPQGPAQLVLRPPDLSHHPHPHSPAPAPLVSHLRAFAPAVPSASEKPQACPSLSSVRPCLGTSVKVLPHATPLLLCFSFLPNLYFLLTY